MSEYQYYEFQAIDRPLTKDELEQMRALSSRATISAASRGTAEPSTAARRRSAAELLDAAHEVRTEHTRQQEQARARARRAEHLARESHLDRLAENTQQAWQDIAHLIGRKQPGPYDSAVTLLKDLREVHDRADTSEEFTRHLHDLREQHRGKSSLMRRLTDAGLTTR